MSELYSRIRRLSVEVGTASSHIPGIFVNVSRGEESFQKSSEIGRLVVLKECPDIGH